MAPFPPMPASHSSSPNIGLLGGRDHGDSCFPVAEE
jgi:hypothetical protein